MKLLLFSKDICVLVIFLFASSACSLFEEEPPKPLPEFFLLAQPTLEADCPEPFGRVCTWTTEDTLTRIVPGRYDRPGSDPDDVWTDLILGDSTQILSLRNIMAEIVPLEVGHRYRVEIASFQIVLSGFPSLIISDDNNLAFYAASGFPLSFEETSIVVPEGWTFELESAGYESQNVGCGLRMTPQTLIVGHGGAHIRMEQGETRPLGAYTVQARIAAEITYPELEECTDTIIPELSVVIYRTPT